jgi:hypothetical protein
MKRPDEFMVPDHLRTKVRRQHFREAYEFITLPFPRELVEIMFDYYESERPMRVICCECKAFLRNVTVHDVSGTEETTRSDHEDGSTMTRVVFVPTVPEGVERAATTAMAAAAKGVDNDEKSFYIVEL